METLAYLHAALAYESTEPESFGAEPVAQPALQPDHQHSARTLLLSATSALCALCALNLFTPSAIAQGSITPGTVLFHGDSGPAVTRLQDLLRNEGYFPIASTGYFGDVTQAALQDFQRAKGLTIDGIAGTNTFKALQPRSTPGTGTETGTGTGSGTGTGTGTGTGSGTIREALAFGDSGAQVSRLQDLLRRAGYFSGPSTGYFGAVTKDSVVRFQKAFRLNADGLVDRATIAALESAPAPGPATGGRPVVNNPVRPVTPVTPIVNNPRPAVIAITRQLQPGDSGDDVKALQQLLTTLKYFNGPVTGFYGPLTETAISNFQKDKNLEVDGIFGSNTARAIR